MNPYIGKICPFCKTEFKEGDDIVVCSSCDMPHHKDCWIENQGCSTFGCLGTIKAANGGSSSVTATELQYDAPTVFCSKCGARHETSSTFCTCCGAPLQTPQAQPQPTAYTAPAPAYTAPTYTPPAQNYNPAPTYTPPAQNYNAGYNTNPGYNAGSNPYSQAVLDPDGIALIGPRQDSYVPKFQTLKRTGGSAGWNWAAFLLTPAWFLYRKMYGIGIGLVCASALINLLEAPFLSLLLLIAEIVLSIFANKLYLQRLESLAGQAKSLSGPYKDEFIRKNGGVSGGAVGTALGCLFVFYLIAYSL